MAKKKQANDEAKKKSEPTEQLNKYQELAKSPRTNLEKKKQKQEKLSDLTICYKALFENSNDGMLFLDYETGKILDVNLSLMNLLGYRQEEILWKTIWEVEAFTKLDMNEESFNALWKEKHSHQMALTLLTKPGKEVEVEFKWNVINLHDDSLVHCEFKDVSESKEMIDELQYKYNLLRTLIDNLPDAIYIKDKQCRKIIANMADVHNMGFDSEAEVIGKNDFENFPKELADGFFHDDSLVLQTGHSILNREEYLLDSEGQKRWLLTSKLPLRDEENKIMGLMGISRDITKRKELEESLKNERNHLSMLIDNLPDLIYFKDIEGKYILSNRAHLQSLGVKSLDEIIGKSAFDFHPPELAREYLDDEMQILRTGKSLLNKEEIAFHHELGKKCWHLTSKVPLIDSNGKITGIIGISHDITEQKEAEEKIYKLNRMYEVQSNINQVIVRIEDIQSLFNEVCEIMVRDGQFKLAWVGLLDEDVKSMKVAASYGAVGDFIENLNIQYNLKTHSNNPTDIIIETSEYFVSNDIESDQRMEDLKDLAREKEYHSYCALPLIVFGSLYGIFHIYSDQRYFFDEKEMRLLDEIKEDIAFCIETIFNNEKRREDEKALLLAKEKAEEANRLKNSFLASMSHEFRTPLNAILGSCSLLKESDDVDANGTKRKLFESIEEGCSRLLTTMTQILDIARIESNDFKIELNPISLSAIISSIYQSIKLKDDKKNLRIDLNLPESEIIVLGDEYCLKGVINNVLQNAIKFSDKGTISIKVWSEEGFGVCSIKDEGIGMSEEYQKHLFEFFSQEDVGYTRRFEGPGLGLALTQKYIGYLKGDIKIKSKKGVGTLVIIKVPLFL